MTFRHTRLPKIAGPLIATRPAAVHKVYAVLLDHADNDTHVSILKKRTIEVEAGLTRRSVMRATAELVALGLIRKSHRGPYAQAYAMATTALFPVDEPEPDPGEHQSVLMLAGVDNPERGAKEGPKRGQKRGHGWPPRGATVGPPKELDLLELDSSSRSVTDGHQGDRVVGDAAAAAGSGDSKNNTAGTTTPTSTAGDLRAGGALAELADDLVAELGDMWPDGHEAVARFQVWLDHGWTFQELADHLTDRALGPGVGNKPGLIVKILRGAPTKPPRRPAPKAPRWCDECDSGWVKDHNGKASNRKCPCRSVTPSKIAPEIDTFRTIPGGAAARSYA